MRLVKEEVGSIYVLHVVEARIDAAVAIAFKERFRSLVADAGPVVILNLAQVTFLDSSGLGAVVAARKLLGEERTLALTALQPAVDKVMTLTRMNTVFPIFPTAAAAIAAYRDAATGAAEPSGPQRACLN